VILGRSQAENERLLDLAVPGDAVNFRGPTLLAAGEPDAASERLIGEMISAYSQDDQDTYLIREEVVGNASSTQTAACKSPRQAFATLRIGERVTIAAM
jgi:hypothetical protein